MSNKDKRTRIWTYGSNTIVSTLLFLGILVFIALIAERHPWRVDLTESGKFTLSEQTQNILKSLDEPIEIKAFYASATPEESQAKDRLDTYRYYSKNINYEFIDPDRNPEITRRYDINSYGTLVLEGYQKKQSIQSDDEETITNAILKLIREEKKKVYFLMGHGERSIKDFNKRGYSSVRSALEKENYETEELNLMQRSVVPDDAAVVVVASPQKPLFKEEISTLQSYLDQGGKIIVFLDPYTEGGMEDFLRHYGIELQSDIVIDQLSRVFGGNYLMPVVTEYGFHKITENFNIATFYSEARSVFPSEQPPEGVKVITLASTSPNAWAERDLELLKQGKASFDENQDRVGPVPLVVMAEVPVMKKDDNKPEESNDSEKPLKEPSNEPPKTERSGEKQRDSVEGFLLVSGDSDFVDNTHFGLSGNGDFFLNAVNYLAEEENLITIERRNKKDQLLIMSQGEERMILGISLVMIPLLVLASGLAVYRIRRS